MLTYRFDGTPLTVTVDVAEQFAPLPAAVEVAAYRLVPAVPSEASVITAGVVAAAGGLYLPLIIVAADCGAFLGDNIAYLVGRRFGTRATKRFLRGGKAQKTLDRAERQLTPSAEAN